MSIFDQLRHDLDPHHLDPGRAIHDIQHGVDEAAHNAEHAIQQAAHQAEGYLRAVQHDAEKGVRGVQHDMESALHKAGDEIKADLKNEVLKLGGEAAKEAIKKGCHTIAKGKAKMDAFKKDKPDLVDAIDQVEVRVGLSVVTAHYSDWYERADSLLTALAPFENSFTLTRTSIKALLTATAPTTVDFDIEGELVTNALGARAGLTFPGALAIELVDEMLEELDVPA